MRYDQRDLEDIEDRLKIDRNDLDAEAVGHPNYFYHASMGHAFAVSRRDLKKHELEVQIAVLDKLVREEMVANEEKITEALVKAQVNREQDYHRAYTIYLDACLEADKWEALKNAYRQRGDMLRGLIQLNQSVYYGEVTGATERRGARDRFDKRREG